LTPPASAQVVPNAAGTFEQVPFVQLIATQVEDAPQTSTTVAAVHSGGLPAPLEPPVPPVPPTEPVLATLAAAPVPPAPPAPPGGALLPQAAEHSIKAEAAAILDKQELMMGGFVRSKAWKGTRG